MDKGLMNFDNRIWQEEISFVRTDLSRPRRHVIRYEDVKCTLTN